MFLLDWPVGQVCGTFYWLNLDVTRSSSLRAVTLLNRWFQIIRKVSEQGKVSKSVSAHPWSLQQFLSWGCARILALTFPNDGLCYGNLKEIKPFLLKLSFGSWSLGSLSWQLKENNVLFCRQHHIITNRMQSNTVLSYIFSLSHQHTLPCIIWIQVALSNILWCNFIYQVPLPFYHSDFQGNIDWNLKIWMSR